MFRSLIIMIFLVLLVACKGGTSIEIFKDSVSVEKITDKVMMQKINAAFEAKSKVVFKKRPDFEYVILVQSDNNSEEWLYSSIGVITKKGEHSQIYKVVGLPETILRKLD